MVLAVRRGLALRAVARHFEVTLRTVQRWVARAGDQRLDRVTWSDRPVGVHRSSQRTSAALEREVLRIRRRLRRDSVLGEFGAAAIQRDLLARGIAAPTVRTIGRILERHGAVDRAGRVRRPAPPPGWHLPAVARGEAEVDLFDVIEDLKFKAGPLIDVLTSVSLLGSLPAAWPLPSATTTAILPCLTAHWRTHGVPHYAQFDNDMRFQGPHQHADAFGRVVRLCLQLGVTPVFVPPYEFGLQNAIEHFNGLYTAKVWRRFAFPSIAALRAHTAQYVAARTERLANRLAAAPPRRAWPRTWEFHPELLRAGDVIFIRRTSDAGRITLLGHTWLVDRAWCNRLVRAEVDLRRGEIRCVALRRRDPTAQPTLTVLPYGYPRGDLTW
jgi:hypothetical protein